MRRFKFNKLVRDHLKDLMESKGSIIHSKILNKEEYIKALEEKLIEEAHEMVDTDNSNKPLIAEEMADIYEVLECLREVLEIAPEEIESARLAKINKRGSFKKRIYFDSVEVNESDPDCIYLQSVADRYPEF